MLRSIEALVTTVTGAALGWLAGAAVDTWLGVGWVAPVMAGVAGTNAAFAGVRGIYAWRTAGGWLAFVLDSTWGIVGSAQALLVNTYNSLRPDSEFSPEYSVRRNRHVFGGGFALKRSFATTQGNVVSNARLGRDAPITDRHTLIEHHEGLHVWQQRWFGPLFPLTYIIVGLVGGIIGLVFGIASRERRRRGVRVGRLVETAAYYDNPFEVWAYRNDDRWESNSAEPVLKWGSFRWAPEDDR